MARVKISELTAKKLLHNYLELPYSGTNSVDSLNSAKKYVVKVDEGIKKRMKQGLVAVDKSQDEVREFVSELTQKGYAHIIVEEMVPHEQSEEKYLSLERVREGFQVFYSTTGGIDIEESGSAQEAIIHADNETEETAAIEKELGVPQLFISQIMGVMNKYHMSFLEINPFVIDNSNVIILDLAVEVDSAGMFSVEGAWTESDFRSGDIREKTQEEKNIEQLASKSQASFKFVPLNPNGSVFMLLSGGGASIVLADEVASLGHGKDLANYGEYSGNPNEEETYLYTKNLLQFLLHSQASKKVLIIAGGVANFTDVRKTFLGVIRAIEEFADELRTSGVKVYVRRGGPNQEEGLLMMREFLEKNGLYGQVSGPDIVLTEIVRTALNN
ncbi:MAG TPA: ATP citrate lyase citrate-binding domain-containing protein [Candidatus Levybacteria bacterium]|nr:ATP citrate lyase citrate-binding domain-containing protein [Candidatus Levybacteria bacterium]